MFDKLKHKFGRAVLPQAEGAGSVSGCVGAPPHQFQDQADKETDAAFLIIEQSPDPAMAAITLATVAVDLVAAVGGRKVARDFVMIQLARVRANAIPAQVDIEGITVADVRAAIEAQRVKVEQAAQSSEQLRVLMPGPQ